MLGPAKRDGVDNLWSRTSQVLILAPPERAGLVEARRTLPSASTTSTYAEQARRCAQHCALDPRDRMIDAVSAINQLLVDLSTFSTPGLIDG